MASRTWLITGCSTGFGRALAQRLLARGEQVVATARNPATLADLAGDHGDRLLALKLDITRQDDVVAAVAAARRRFGSIDVLVNNAGYGDMGVVEETPVDVARAMMETNFFGALAMIRAVVAEMRERGAGQVVNVGSVAGQIGFPGLGYYSASKFALAGLTESLAAELRPLGVRVTLAELGPFATDFTRNMTFNPPPPHYDMAALAQAAGNAAWGAGDDPQAGVAALLAALDDPDPPVRLVLGQPGLDVVALHDGRRAQEREKWLDRSRLPPAASWAPTARNRSCVAGESRIARAGLQGPFKSGDVFGARRLPRSVDPFPPREGPSCQAMHSRVPGASGVSSFQGPVRDAPQDLTRISAAVGVARVICILGIVYVHAWTGRDAGGLAAAATTFQGVLRWVLMELLGRSAVPLLGMISGWLAVGSVRKRPYASFLAGRARTVLAPMALWNVAAILIVSGAGYLGLIGAPVPRSWSWVVNEVFCLTAPNEINVQMPFLRDLFVCIAMAPLLARLPRGALLAVAAAAAAWSVSGLAFPLLLRPQILLFFAIGVMARRDGLERRVAARPLATFAIPYAGLALAGAWVGAAGDAHGPPPAWMTASLDLLLRFAAGAFFWSLAWRLAVRPVGRALLRVEPYIFLTFCTHMIVIWLAGPTIGRVTGPLGAPLYPLFLLTQPLLVLAGAVGLGRFLESACPAAARLLGGGRLQARGGAGPARASGASSAA